MDIKRKLFIILPHQGIVICRYFYFWSINTCLFLLIYIITMPEHHSLDINLALRIAHCFIIIEKFMKTFLKGVTE